MKLRFEKHIEACSSVLKNDVATHPPLSRYHTARLCLSNFRVGTGLGTLRAKIMKPRQAQPRQCSVLATKLLNGGHFRSGPPLVLHMALSLMKLQAAWHSAEVTGDAMLHQPARHGNLGERCILAAAIPPTHRFVGESNGTDWSSICRGSAVRGFGQAQHWRIANKLLQHGRLAAGAAAFDFTCLPGLCCIFALTFPCCNGNALPFMNEINYKVLN